MLLGVGFEGDQLDALRALGRSDTLEEDLRAQFLAYIEWFVATLAPRLQGLAKGEAVTVGEMQDKFSQDARGFLEYGSLNVFFGGLEAQVGSPSPKVWQMMAEEHTNRGDSTRMFKPNNYDVLTRSDWEWMFTTSPDTPPEGGWPEEEKIRRAHGIPAQCCGDGCDDCCCACCCPMCTQCQLLRHTLKHAVVPQRPGYPAIPATYEFCSEEGTSYPPPPELETVGGAGTYPQGGMPMQQMGGIAPVPAHVAQSHAQGGAYMAHNAV